jgi:NAD(P)-dependent dehydrogenase (short-subunit alcohol dehydrogenase family)
LNKSQAIRFDGQVAIVTGAGGGLGRAFATELAQRGAAVLVNDYGGDTSGRGGSAERAQIVADELRAAGHRAVADSTAVGTFQSAAHIRGHALDAFGRIDILVNNAGISLPGPITEASDEAVEQHFRVNLQGPYALVRAVWPDMSAQRYGRILNVSSNAVLGIGANAPYGTSKAGLIGLTLDAAREGMACGIQVNAVMPVAFTRLIEQIPDPDFVAWFREYMPARKVAAAMSFFLSRESDVTGRVLSAGGGRLARIAFAENAGIVDADDAESVRERCAQALDPQNCRVLESAFDELQLYAQVFPWNSAGAGPVLSEAAVTGARKEVRK